jgi:hypothetical protein
MGATISTPQQLFSDSTYYHLGDPVRIDDLQKAAWIWKEIAEREGIMYAFAGSFVAKFRAPFAGIHVKKIEIVISPTFFLHTDIAAFSDRHKEKLAITPHGEHIIITRPTEHSGVAVHIVEAGTNGYPADFIPPYDSPARTLQHQQLQMEPTFRCLELVGPYGEVMRVPALVSRFLLHERLLRFQRNQHDPHESFRDLQDIRVLLQTSAIDGDGPFAPYAIATLYPIVNDMMKHQHYNYMPMTKEELGVWQSLGFTQLRAAERTYVEMMGNVFELM